MKIIAKFKAKMSISQLLHKKVQDQNFKLIFQMKINIHPLYIKQKIKCVFDSKKNKNREIAIKKESRFE
jgi:hypothetical protein